jgi:hypothetical protein
MRRWLAVPAVVLAGAAAAVTWIGYRATRLPDWYAHVEGAEPAGDPPGARGRREVAPPEADSGWQVVPRSEGGPGGAGAEGTAPGSPGVATVRRERRGLPLKRIAGDPALRAAVRASRAVYEDGRLEVGLVVDTGAVDPARLRPEARRIWDRARRSFPVLEDRKLYLALVDEPLTRGGFLQLGPRPVVRVGELEESLDSVARRLGVDPGRVRAGVDRVLRELELREPGG